MIAPNNEENSQTPEGDGGNRGAERVESGLTRQRDSHLNALAIRQRWPIKREKKRKLIEKLFDVALGDGAKPREAISAARAIISAEGQNQQDDLPPPQQNDNRVIIANMTAQEMELLNRLNELRHGIPSDDELNTIDEPSPEENGNGDYIPS
jgi:hypothetical protein